MALGLHEAPVAPGGPPSKSRTCPAPEENQNDAVPYRIPTPVVCVEPRTLAQSFNVNECPSIDVERAPIVLNGGCCELELTDMTPSSPVQDELLCHDVDLRGQTVSSDSGQYILDCGKPIGEGGFGTVYRCQLTSVSLQTVAGVDATMAKKDVQLVVKSVKMSGQLSAEDRQNGFNRERDLLELLSRDKHPNIMTLKDIATTKTGAEVLVLQFYGCSVRQRLQPSLPDALSWKWAHQLLSAVSYLHRQRICHLDLKPDNLLLDDEDNLVVADFNMSQFHSDPVPSNAGTVPYRPPELLRFTKSPDLCGFAVDRWSAGVVILELFAKENVIFAPSSAVITTGLGVLNEIKATLSPKGKSKYGAAGHRALEAIRKANLTTPVRDLLSMDPEGRCSAADALRLWPSTTL